MDKQLRELKVTAIENGTVIDHIPAHNVLKVLHILNLENSNNQLLIGDNLESAKFGKKGIIKVSNTFFDKDEIDKIALVAPSATLIVIKNYAVAEKRQVSIPKKVENIVKCFNPNCITNREAIPTRFTVVDEQEIKLQCHYCEKITPKASISFL